MGPKVRAGFKLLPVQGTMTKLATATVRPIAMGAKLPAGLVGWTAVIRITHMSKKVPTSSAKNPDPTGNSGCTTCTPRSMGACSPSVRLKT
jgi:hypothetical protein